MIKFDPPVVAKNVTPKLGSLVQNNTSKHLGLVVYLSGTTINVAVLSLLDKPYDTANPTYVAWNQGTYSLYEGEVTIKNEG